MLLWSRSSRALIWGAAAILIGAVYIAPLAVILLASLAGEWNGVLPSQPTFVHFVDAVSGDSGLQLRASLITGQREI